MYIFKINSPLDKKKIKFSLADFTIGNDNDDKKMFRCKECNKIQHNNNPQNQNM